MIMNPQRLIVTLSLLLFFSGLFSYSFSQSRQRVSPDDLLKSFNGQKRGDIYEFDQDLVFVKGNAFDNKQLLIGPNQTVAVCGDLIINSNMILLNEGNLIIKGSLKVDNVKTSHVNPYKFSNSGNVIIGGDLLGKDEVNAMNSSYSTNGGPQTLHSGYMLVKGSIKDHDKVVSSGLIWATAVNSHSYATIAGVNLVGDLMIVVANMPQMKDIIHHFEELKTKECDASSSDGIAEIEDALNHQNLETIYNSSKNKQLMHDYSVYSELEFDLTTKILWHPNYNTNVTIKNYTVQVSKDTSTFKTISEVIPSRDKSKFEVRDPNKDNDRFIQKYYKFVVVKNDGTVDEVILKGAQPRLQYFKHKFGNDVIELPNYVTAPNGQKYSVFLAKPNQGVLTLNKGRNSTISFDVYPNEMLIVCGDLIVNSDGVDVKIFEGGILGVTRDFKFTQKPPLYTKGTYSFSNKGVILVGRDYADMANPSTDIRRQLTKQIGLMLVGHNFTTNNKQSNDGVWVDSYFQVHGGIIHGIFEQSSFIEKEFAVPQNATKLNRELVKMALYTYKNSIKDSQKCQGSDFHLIEDKITDGERTRGKSVENIYPPDMVKRAGNLGFQDGKNFELQASQILSSGQYVQKFLHIGQDTTLTICGDLVLDGNFYMSNYGNLIVTGDLILENNNPMTSIQFKALNIGNIVVGGDFKGVDIMTESYPGFASSDAGRSFILGKVFKHSNTNNQWLEEIGDDSNIFQINAIGDIENIGKDEKLEEAIDSYLKISQQCSGVNQERIAQVDTILMNTIGLGLLQIEAKKQKSKKKVEVKCTLPHNAKMKSLYVLRRDTKNKQKYTPASFSDVSRKKGTFTFQFVDDHLNHLGAQDSVQYIVVGSRRPLTMSGSGARTSSTGSGHRRISTSTSNPTSGGDFFSNMINQHSDKLKVSSPSFWVPLYEDQPVTLSRFSAEVEGDHVNLVWVDEQEINASHFVIERSTDGRNYEEISDKIQASGNSNTELSYSFVDENPPSVGTAYYRLKEVDFDGRSETWVRSVHLIESDEMNVRIFPIPADDVLHVQITHQDMEDVTLKLVEATTGRVSILHGSFDYDQMIYNVNSVNSGIYIVEIFANGKMIHNQKIVIN